VRSIERLPLLALLAALTLAAATCCAPLVRAQPPDQKQEFRQGFGRPSPISVDDIVERIMAFDKNKDGKVTKDELPERMQFLIELGDTNKDGALDKEEIKKLATTLAAAPGGFGFRGDFRVGPGPGGPGFGVGVGGGFGPGPGAIEGVVEDLKLSGKKKDQALLAVKAHQENVGKLMGQARAELLQNMKQILSEQELEDFKAALDRPRGATTIINPGPDGPRPVEIERRIEQLQKELDDLRHQQRR
jgi:hypothetical protein